MWLWIPVEMDLNLRETDITVTRYEDYKNKWLDFIAFIASLHLIL